MLTAENLQKGAAIHVEAVEKSFDVGGPVLTPMSFDIKPGEFVSLLGPSGCGKSTMLRLIAGLDSPSAGQIKIDVDAKFFRGFVFQDAQLLPWRTVLANVTLPFELMRKPNAERDARDALARVGLGDALDKYPNQLSGGMKMRVSVARALVSKPRLLLLDEPFAALDERSRHVLQTDLRNLWLELGMTVVFVTHSVAEAVYLSDRAILFSNRPARIVLDHEIMLGRKRPSELRLDPKFQSEVGKLGGVL